MALTVSINPTQAATLARPAAEGMATMLQADAARDKLLREAVDAWVGLSFFGTLMRQFRASQDTSSPFHGGQGERIFGARLDQEIAERMGRRFRSRLGASIYRQLKGSAKRTVRPAQRTLRATTR